MDFQSYSTEFETRARKAGYSSDLIKKCLQYAEFLHNHNVPVIYNSDHLAALVGYSKNYLKRAVAYPASFYRMFSIPKKHGGERTIFEPLPSLKEIQKWILTNILYKIEVHSFAKAYVPGLTLKDNLKYHKRKPLVYTLDINDFFGSISFDRVESIFRDVGYSAIISNLLCKLIMKGQALCQGAPTSPCVSNLVMRDFDKTLSTYCKAQGIMFTRYADDLTFSSKAIETESLAELVQEELAKIGLTINSSKTKVMKEHNRQMVTGVVVNAKPQIRRAQRKYLRQQVYYIRKFGIKDHMMRNGLTRKNYLKHLLGQINFALFLNPRDKQLFEFKIYLIGLQREID